MKRVWCVLIVCAVAGTPVLAQQKAEQPEPKVEGVWKLTFAARDGRPLIQDGSVHWTIDAKGNVRQHSGPDVTKSDPNRTFTLTFDHKARAVDYKEDRHVAPGIYEVKDDGHTITFCFNDKKPERPKVIDSDPMYGYTVYRLTRVKADKK
jgi:uncharacterized protein (TIGR03067 family)